MGQVLRFQEHGHVVSVIPGISSAIAAPGLAGIPLTMRGVADSFVVATAHGKNDSGQSPWEPARWLPLDQAALPMSDGLPWRAAARLPAYVSSRTLVLLMGARDMAELAVKLQAPSTGYPGHLAVAVVEKASHPGQRSFFTTLDRLGQDTSRLGLRPPAVVVVGDVVSAFQESEHARRATGALPSSVLAGSLGLS
jgi:siroheme synthase